MGSGFRVPVFGFQVSGLGSRVSSSGYRVSGAGSRNGTTPQRNGPIGSERTITCYCEFFNICSVWGPGFGFRFPSCTGKIVPRIEAASFSRGVEVAGSFFSGFELTCLWFGLKLKHIHSAVGLKVSVVGLKISVCWLNVSGCGLKFSSRKGLQWYLTHK